MIGWFPTPYPDELLFSICARYQERMAYTSPMAVNEDLIGVKHSTLSVDLPCYLERLASVLPSGHHITADRLIDNHTLLPFYSPFLPADRAERIRNEMRYCNGNKVHKMAGTSCSIRPPNWLRFCPTCMKEDRVRFGCTYWHRLHQLPGINICADHAVFLESSQTYTRDYFTHSGYVSAEQAVEDLPARHLTPSDTSQSIQLSIARSAKWVISHGNFPSDLQGLRSRYLMLLSEQKLALVTGNVWAGKLMSAIKDYFTSDLLKVFQCDFDEKKSTSWPVRLMKSISVGIARHPLRHLLLIQFLGHEAESFFNLPSVFQPFGRGPWPCLNLTCSHYGKRDLNEIQVMYRIVRRQRQVPVGNFKCVDCGFTYTRIGPDREDEDLKHIGRVLEYGPVWEAALRRSWRDSKLSLGELAKRFGVANPKIIKREAERLGLPFPRQVPGYKAADKSEKRKHQRPNRRRSHPNKLSKEDIKKYRQEWRLALKINSEFTRTALHRKFGRVHSMLYKYDSKWLSAHMPCPQKAGWLRRPINWPARDAELATAVKATVEILIMARGKPVRITRTLIGRKTGRRINWNQLERLPQTVKALNKVGETRLQFLNAA